jgi:hypothetical protein
MNAGGFGFFVKKNAFLSLVLSADRADGRSLGGVLSEFLKVSARVYLL